MSYWLMKSEPDVYPWTRLVKEKRAPWDGVRNYQANNNMKAMRIGDEAFFYHSNEGREVVGIMKIAKLWRPDPSDESGKFGMVEVVPVEALPRPVTLAEIKANPLLRDMALVRQGRLSVSPVAKAEWRAILKMSRMVSLSPPK
ncbi:MAG: EVE domain-containing protein [Alphaproteobacteria bacterium]|nr:EVE domain-containing protein [Alphaproteobacteria bacterium]